MLRGAISSVAISPPSVGADGGPIDIEARLIEGAEPAGRVYAVVRGPDGDHEVALARDGASFRGRWTAPAAASRDYAVIVHAAFPFGEVVAKPLSVKRAAGAAAAPPASAPAPPRLPPTAAGARPAGAGAMTALATPECWYISLLNTLKAADYRHFEKLFTRKASADVTEDVLAAAVSHLHELGATATFAEVPGGGVKVMLPGGAALTTLKQDPEGWKADAVPELWLIGDSGRRRR
jgi:hypothetical protein